MSACPACRRRSFTRNDLLHARIDTTVTCRACGQVVRLDVFSRFAVSCVIALVLPALLLYWDIFYSGHLFIFSMLFIFAAWRLLSAIMFPILGFESVKSSVVIDPRQNRFVAAALLLAALGIDGFMASKFESPEEYAGESVNREFKP